MSFLSILSQFFLGPLKLLFEVIFKFFYEQLQNPGFAIVFLSLSVNLLVLPLYRRADIMQEKARDTEAALHDGVAHIKKTFSGNERMMMLQTYYRQNNYSPTHVMRGSVSLLLQIPFFMAAYQFLSHLDALQGVSFGPIQDLGVPDGLLKIGSLQLNLLPILMTLINFISSAIYLKGFPLKTKVQLYGLAVFFLVFLYSSPAGLLFYWTLNNAFSLAKNIFFKVLKDPKKTLIRLTAALGALAILLFFTGDLIGHGGFRRPIVLYLGLALELPMLISLLRRVLPARKAEKTAARPSRAVFLLGALVLTVLVGALIPSTYLAASPQEYVDISYFFHPLWYLVSALSLAGGFFLLWLGVFYWLASPKGKVIMERLVWVLCGVALINDMFFGTKLGVISSTLRYEGGMSFEASEVWINLAVVLAASALLLLAAKKWRKLPTWVLPIMLVALTVMSVGNVSTVRREVSAIRVQDSDEMPHFTISKNGKNVFILFVDRALGGLLPYLMQEKPELQEAFDGFTYYDNVISFGGSTNFGLPSMVGGYEYTPVELNKRDTEPLVEKHNEALKVLPVLFSENGYQVTVFDPPYANYQWITDLSIYEEYPAIKGYNTKGYFTDPRVKQQTIDANLRNFYRFSLMKTVPVALQPIFYDAGGYWNLTSESVEDPANVPTPQQCADLSNASGYNPEFMDAYSALSSLRSMTEISRGDENTFCFYANNTPHEPALLSEPEYEPAPVVDNTEFDAAHTDRFALGDRSLNMDSTINMQHYQVNMAALIQIGNWLDYLRENGVYDNTRIIIVADHGRDLGLIDELLFERENGSSPIDLGRFFPLMLYKDFNSKGFTTDHSFMTNADTPLLALDEVIENPVNPFTGKALDDTEKHAHPQYITLSKNWSTKENHGNTFTADSWISVEGNIWEKQNWIYFPEITVLPQ